LARLTSHIMGNQAVCSCISRNCVLCCQKWEKNIIPSHSDMQWPLWTPSPWRRKFWKCCKEACRDHWLEPGEIAAGICALSSELSAKHQEKFLIVDNWKEDLYCFQ